MEKYIIIYRITCKCGMKYIGSTENIKSRIAQHKHKCYNNKNDRYHIKLYQHIRNCCNWDELYIQEIFRGNYTKEQQRKVETYFQKKFNTINNGLNVLYAWTDKWKQKLKYDKKWIKTKKGQECYKRRYVVIVCECGRKIQKHELPRHKRSKIHHKLVSQLL